MHSFASCEFQESEHCKNPIDREDSSPVQPSVVHHVNVGNHHAVDYSCCPSCGNPVFGFHFSVRQNYLTLTQCVVAWFLYDAVPLAKGPEFLATLAPLQSRLLAPSCLPHQQYPTQGMRIPIRESTQRRRKEWETYWKLMTNDCRTIEFEVLSFKSQHQVN